MTELLSYLKKSPEEQVERAQVAKDIRVKSFGGAACVGFAVCVFFAANGHEAGGIILGFFAFLLSLPFAGIFVSAFEKEASARRIAERHEQQKRKQERADAEKQQEQIRKAKEREKQIQNDQEIMQAAAAEQELLDNRGHLVTKVHAALNTLIHYDPSSSAEDRRLITHAVASELSDISAQYPRCQLTSLIERNPDVRSALVALKQGLHAHGIDIPAASELFRAMR